MNIGERLLKVRTHKGITQAKLAERVSASQQAIQFIEDGTTKKSKYLPDLAKVLEIDYEWLATGKGNIIGEETNDRLSATLCLAVAENIKAARINAGLSQIELAELCGWDQGRQSHYETGRNEPGLMQIQVIAEHVNTSLSDLLGDTIKPGIVATKAERIDKEINVMATVTTALDTLGSSEQSRVMGWLNDKYKSELYNVMIENEEANTADELEIPAFLRENDKQNNGESNDKKR